MSVSYKSYEIGRVWKRKGDSFVMSRQEVSICYCYYYYDIIENIQNNTVFVYRKYNIAELLCGCGDTGASCQLVDYCASQPCRHGGHCTSTVASFRCRCMPGYVGRTCSDDVNECVSRPCENAGTCTNTIGSYR